MSLVAKFSYLFLAVLTCCQSALSAKPTSLSFIQCPWERDGRQWKPVEYKSYPSEGIVKYLPVGHKTDTWKELVTTQWLENCQKTPREYFDSFVLELRDLFPNGKLAVNILQTTNLALLAEWQHSQGGDSASTRYGLVKVFALYPNIYLLTYTACDIEKSAIDKTMWLSMFQEAQLSYQTLEVSQH